MECRGNSDDAVVDSGRDEFIDGCQHSTPAGNSVRITAGVGDGNKLNTWQRTENARVVAPHHSEADEARPQISHYAPADATLVTAAAMRSRSSCESEG